MISLFSVEARPLKSFIVDVFSTLQTLIMWQWLHSTASVSECVPRQRIPQGISRKSHLEKDRENFRRAAFIMCHKCWEAVTWRWVSCVSPSCCLHPFFVFFLSQGLCDKTCMHSCNFDPAKQIPAGGKKMKWNQPKTQGQEFSPNRWERKETLPDLSASDVACWAELSLSGILGRSGTADPRRAEECGREDWQEPGRGGSIQRASLCCDWVTGQRDGCMFTLFRRTVVLSMLCARVKQMRVVKLDVGCFFFVASQWKYVWQEWKEQFFLPISLRIHSHLQPVNNDQHQWTLTHNLVAKQKKGKRNIEEGTNTLWRWLRKLGWKRTEIAFGAVWLRL